MHIFGIRIRVSPSWFYIGVFFTLDMAGVLIGKRVPEGTAWLCGVAYALLFGASILAHELGHSRVFQHYGGHIEEIRLWALGGIASMAAEPEEPRQEFWVSIAGPLVNISLAAVFSGVIFVANWFDAPYYVWYVARRLMILNLVVGLFNLVPFFPLDGGHVLRSLLWERTNDWEKASRTAAAVTIGTGFVAKWTCLGLFIRTFQLRWAWYAFMAVIVSGWAKQYVVWIRTREAQG